MAGGTIQFPTSAPLSSPVFGNFESGRDGPGGPRTWAPGAGTSVASAPDFGADEFGVVPSDVIHEAADFVVDSGETLVGTLETYWDEAARASLPPARYYVDESGTLVQGRLRSLPYEIAVKRRDIFARAGRVAGAAGLLASGYDIYVAEDRGREAIKKAFGAAGGVVGRQVGASVGGTACAAGVVTAPATPVCAAIGGAVGSVVGSQVFEAAGDRLAPQLQEWGEEALGWGVDAVERGGELAGSAAHWVADTAGDVRDAIQDGWNSVHRSLDDLF